MISYPFQFSEIGIGRAKLFLLSVLSSRWVDFIILSLVALLICFILNPYLTIIGDNVSSLTITWPIAIHYLFASFISGGLLYLMTRIGGFHIFQMKLITICRYPPTWLSGILGAVVYLTAVQNVFGIHYENLIYFLKYLSFVIIGLIIASIYSYPELYSYHKQEKLPEDIKEPTREIDINFKSISKWIAKETPITRPQEDLLGISRIAKRISSKLLMESIQTIGVIGPYGCGKSSLLNLIEYYLINKDIMHMKDQSNFQGRNERTFLGNFVVCRVDGWGRTKGSIAQQILSIALNCLKTKIDCLSIITLPADYKKALEGSVNSWAAIISTCLSPTTDPIKQLTKLDNILGTGGMRLIIFLEDLDRNLSDEIIRDELPSLLDRLRSLRCVSFVLAIGTEHHYSNILVRICDHVETIA